MSTSGGLRVAVLTVSDSAARGEREDRSGRLCAEWAVGRGGVVVEHAVVADETAAIAARLTAWCDAVVTPWNLVPEPTTHLREPGERLSIPEALESGTLSLFA